MKREKKQRQYRLSDLAAMAEQLGCRVRLEIVPKELFEPRVAGTTPRPEPTTGEPT